MGTINKKKTIVISAILPILFLATFAAFYFFVSGVLFDSLATFLHTKICTFFNVKMSPDVFGMSSWIFKIPVIFFLDSLLFLIIAAGSYMALKRTIANVGLKINLLIGLLIFLYSLYIFVGFYTS